MRLDSVVVADAAAQSGGKLSILGAWITRFSPHRFPWSEPITVVVRILLDEGDEDAEHIVSIGFNGPLAMSFPTEFRLVPEQLAAMAQERVEGEEAAVTVAATQHGLQFTGPGVLQIEISVDGELIRRYPIVVTDAPPPDES